ncbi:hypothetical protein [Luteibacter sp. SG786]|uniref:hypothetical protein n=1 Tax=Luteibacter sp. SG786 TaxID=2587130 RepID=UPI00141DBBC2|nr:hypothetical protein [Luteibacter sp. SG786]NII55941.1 hypothetical protein [Luteibacter sp. SG786]
MHIETGTIARSPSASTPGWRLQKERPNAFGYRDNPIERGRPSEVEKDLPDQIRGRLRNTDIHAIESRQLHDLAANLFWEGYISEDAFVELAIYAYDHAGTLDLSTWLDRARTTIKDPGFAQYRCAIRIYEATIDAVEGLSGLVDYLSGRLLDAQA